MSAVREFELGSMPLGDKRVASLRIKCRCGISDVVQRRRIQGTPDDGSKAARMATEQFEKKGWAVGYTAGGDLCPTCAKRVAPPKMPAFKVVERTSMTQPAIKPAAPATPVRSAIVETPRAMGIDDALLIAGKLNEVYVDANKGYGGDWTDAKVAFGLGVPRAWVTEVRRKQYGQGSADNDEIRDSLAQSRRLVEEARIIIKAMEDADVAMRKAVAEAALLKARFEKMERTLASVENALR